MKHNEFLELLGILFIVVVCFGILAGLYNLAKWDISNSITPISYTCSFDHPTRYEMFNLKTRVSDLEYDLMQIDGKSHGNWIKLKLTKEATK